MQVEQTKHLFIHNKRMNSLFCLGQFSYNLHANFDVFHCVKVAFPNRTVLVADSREQLRIYALTF